MNQLELEYARKRKNKTKAEMAAAIGKSVVSYNKEIDDDLPYTGVLNVDQETGHIYDEDGDAVDEDTLGTFCAGDGKGDDEDE